MTVNKFIKSESPWQATPSTTVNILTNIDQLAIWTYLIHRPSSWIPRENQIREHFGIGHDRYKKALRGLRDAGLAWWERERGKNGRITRNTLHICTKPYERHIENQNETAELPENDRNEIVDFSEIAEKAVGIEHISSKTAGRLNHRAAEDRNEIVDFSEIAEKADNTEHICLETTGRLNHRAVEPPGGSETPIVKDFKTKDFKTKDFKTKDFKTKDFKTYRAQEIDHKNLPNTVHRKTPTNLSISNIELPEGVSNFLVQEFIKHRKAIKKPVTDYALSLALKHASKADSIGMTPTQAIEETIAAGWAGVNLKWLDNRQRAGRRSSGNAPGSNGKAASWEEIYGL